MSYASADAAVANQVCLFLESRGVSCWMAPRDVKPGAAYADAIVRAINEASALVLVLSTSAMASEHVSREVERAASKHKPVVAFRVDAANLSAELEYFLSRSQWIDVPTLGMAAAFAKVVEAVGQGAPSSKANPGAGRWGGFRAWKHQSGCGSCDHCEACRCRCGNGHRSKCCRYSCRSLLVVKARRRSSAGGRGDFGQVDRRAAICRHE